MTREEFEKKFCKGDITIAETDEFDEFFLEELIEQIEYIDKYANFVYIMLYAPNYIELVVNGYTQFHLNTFEDFGIYVEVFYKGFRQGIESNAK